MIYFLAGVLLLGFFWWLGKNYTKADPQKLAIILRKGTGYAALGLAAILLLRGRIDMAVFVGGLGWWLAQGQRLDAYLHSRYAARRENAEGNTDAGNLSRMGADSMSEQEALDILGLPSGVGEEDIRSAHRTLMQKLHPDKGGTNYLATRINQAKDTLLSRHR